MSGRIVTALIALSGIAAFVWVVLSRVLDAALVEEWEG